ncbi:MAG TPA: hypothetical protein VK796_12220, partial [Cytophaga sp.]|nr:hypothetical protein [Cytophaga sp.]
FILPFMGKLYDSKTLAHMPAEYTLEALHTIDKNHADIELLNTAQLAAGIETLQLVAILPVILTVVFVGIYLVRKKSHNYEL